MLAVIDPTAPTGAAASLRDSLEATAFGGLAWLGAGIADTLAALGLEVSAATAAALGAAVLALGVLALVTLGLRLFRRPAAAEPDLRQLTRLPRRMGLAATAVLVAFFGGWSVLAPLASAALAPGVVSPDGNRKTVQHLEGGIIRTIHVREGDRVAVGDPLVTLDDTQARAHYEELRERHVYLLGTEARLNAERTDAAEIEFPSILADLELPGAERVMAAQRELLASRRATHQGRERILASRIRQLEEQNTGLDEVIAAQDEQIALIEEEIASTQQLFDKGLERMPRLLALKRAKADLEAEKAANRARIAENAQAMGETEIQLLTLTEDARERVNDELANVQRQLAELRSQIPSREDLLSRTVVRAPLDGTVMNVLITTETGVVRPGDALLEIVPDNAALIVDARVKPTDIDRVHPGMEARVVLTAYRQRTLPLIHGTLRSISADALVEERSGESYFLAKVEVKPEDLAKIEEVQLSPGMPAEVMILDGEQTLLDYLLAPIVDSMRRSFRES